MKVIGFMYAFLFACVFTAKAVNPNPKKAQNQPNQNQQQAQAKDCVKHPIIVKSNAVTAKPADKPKIASHVTKPTLNKSSNSVPHFSVLNFINFFYSKDSLDNLQVM